LNGELPLVAAGSGGAAMLAGMYLYERRRDEAMRRSRVRLGLRFPAGLEPLRAFAALDGLSGLPYTGELVAELTAREGCIGHALWVPAGTASSARSILTGGNPEPADHRHGGHASRQRDVVVAAVRANTVCALD
jgi:hypothetical protein